MFNRAILENGGTLKSIPDCYKNQEMRNKAVITLMHYNFFLNAIRLKMCDKAVHTHPPTIKYVPECYKAQETCYRAVHRWFFLYLGLFLFNIKLKKYVT